MASFWNWITRREDASYVYDLDMFEETSNRAYLKRMALDICCNYVARTVSQTVFRHMKNGTKQKDDWDYWLNVKPNSSQNAALFWEDLTYKLIRNNEVLVVQSDDYQLLVADSFTRKQRALYPDTFEGVTINDYTYQRTFSYDNVWYLTYNNKKLDNYIGGLYEDWGKMLGRMIEVNLRNNQIRGKFKIHQTKGNQDTEKQQKFIDKVVKSYLTKSVAFVPETSGIEVEETNTTSKNSSQSFDELLKLLDSFVDQVANIIGIPPALIHGQVADVSDARISFEKNCIGPLLNKIKSELDAKAVTEYDYKNYDDHFVLIGVNAPTILGNADKIDKAVSNGAITPNEVRNELYLEPIEGGDEMIITKNYQKLKGGEEENDDDNQD
ncbi:phage portal protein [Latilactobacillus sakei]|uniref:phage portal protein n=1 Tax=Latilactobacillus sakei TaxID=1599 RepID=UPI003F52ADEE